MARSVNDLLAPLADAENFHTVLLRYKTISIRQRTTQMLNAFIKDFKILSALGTDKMGVIFAAQFAFEPSDAIVKIDHFGQTAGNDQLQGSVHRGIPYFRMPGLDQPEKVFRAEMLFRF